ncbi:glycosyltransferase family 2 protein [Photobacterium leiognathi]|uniref:glycosyltransferase family 2 protein n=1 Tax=Photobacterium leiognathi TaxID=553611 RepID=UPI0029810944|nr:glycosyltransferase [Photobacterium leiognathi]
MKISVIIPVYNTSKYLQRCLNSLINQSLYDVEFIIVNDGSTDNSLSIINDFLEKDERIIVINQKNSGLSSARNSGLKVSKGDYILHIDSDDWVEADYLKDMYNKAVEKKLDIVVSDFIWDWDDGVNKYKKDLTINDDDVITGGQYLKRFLSFDVSPVVWNKLFKAEIYHSNGIRHPENISLGEDLATTPLLVNKANRIGKVNKAYVHYIQNYDSISNKISIKKANELTCALNIIRANIKNVNLDEYEFKSLTYTLFFVNIDNEKDSLAMNILIKNYIGLSKRLKNNNNLNFKLKTILFLLKIFPFSISFKIIKKMIQILKL